MLLPRHTWEAVGGFDPGYWMYLEDADLCWRLRHTGWRTVWEPAATITHTGGRSSRSRPVRSIMAHHRSAARFYWRTAGWHRPMTTPVAVVALAARAGVQVLTRPGRAQVVAAADEVKRASRTPRGQEGSTGGLIGMPDYVARPWLR